MDEEIISLIIQSYGDGRPPSQILREVILRYPETTVPGLMEFMQNAFSIPYESVQCIGGWWYDGTGELSDAQLDAFLIRAIQAA